MRLLRGYKTVLKVVSLKVYLEVEISVLSLYSKELKVGRKELERYIIYNEITSLKVKSSYLTDLISYVLYELYSKYTLYLLNQRITLYIYIVGNNLLYLILVYYSTFISNNIINISMN